MNHVVYESGEQRAGGPIQVGTLAQLAAPSHHTISTHLLLCTWSDFDYTL